MIKSPSTYGKKGYEEYRKKEKMKKKTDPEKGPNTVVSYTKYAVIGESKEVPATTGLEQNQPKQKKSLKK